MLGILGSLFVLILSVIYYEFMTLNNQDWVIEKNIQLSKLVEVQKKSIFAGCIDKQEQRLNDVLQLKLMSRIQKFYLITFNQKPSIQCNKLIQNIDFNPFIEQKITNFSVSLKLNSQFKDKTIFKDLQATRVQENICATINDNKNYLLIFSIQERPANADKIILAFTTQNYQFSQQVLRSIFWFSWFNLIGICLISYYRKNVFRTKVRLLYSVTILVFFLFLPIALDSLLKLNQYLYLLVICYIGLLYKKNKLSLWVTIMAMFFFYLNQNINIVLQYVNFQQPYLIQTIILFNLMNIALNVHLIKKTGQFNEIQKYTFVNILLFSFLTNKIIFDGRQLMVNMLIAGMIMFGVTFLQILQWQADFQAFKKKSKVRLQSYELSQSDKLEQN